MNAEQLKAMQAPLKEKYRSDPAAALVTLKATGKAGQGATCSIETAKGMQKAGLHPATGGDGVALCSGDLLLQALVACAGVTLSAVSTALAIPVEDATLTAEGDLDFRGTLGVSKEVPVGFKAIRLEIALKSTATTEQLDTLMKLTERYCVVYQTIKSGVPLTVVRRGR